MEHYYNKLRRFSYLFLDNFLFCIAVAAIFKVIGWPLAPLPIWLLVLSMGIVRGYLPPMPTVQKKES